MTPLGKEWLRWSLELLAVIAISSSLGFVFYIWPAMRQGAL